MRAYLDLRKKARQDRRPVDELMQQTVHLPRILGGEIAVRGYPLAMVHAEKIVTAIGRGTTSTRWRDFADMYMLSRHHAIDGTELSTSIREVARTATRNSCPRPGAR